MANLLSYYCALKGIDEAAPEPDFQDESLDRIREVPQELNLPSVPQETPSELLKNSSDKLASDPEITYPDPPDTLYYIPITASQELRVPMAPPVSCSDESEEITYPDPPETVYVIPITASQEMRMPPSSDPEVTYPDPPESVYLIPITHETPCEQPALYSDGTDEEIAEVPEESEDDDLDLGSEDEAQVDGEDSTIPETESENETHVKLTPPGSYYLIPITNPQLLQKQAQSGHGGNNYYPGAYYPYIYSYPLMPYPAYAPVYQPPYYPYQPHYYSPYQPGYLHGGSKRTQPSTKTPAQTEKTNFVLPDYARPSYAPPGSQMVRQGIESISGEENEAFASFSSRVPSTHLFEDMFARADKSDDGGLTFEEFRDYFSDEILSDEELLCLFTTMDANKNGIIELSEVVDYFMESFGPFSQLFGQLEGSNRALTECLGVTFEAYEKQERFEQFRTRVFMRECLRQAECLDKSVRSSLQAMIGSSRCLRSKGGYQGLISSDVIRNVAVTPVEDSDTTSLEILQEQISKLACAVEELVSSRGILRQVNQTCFDVGTSQEDSYVVVTRKYRVIPEMVLHFRDATRIYINHVKEAGGNLQIYVRQSSNDSFSVYEIWEDNSYLAIHNQSLPFRQYQKDLVESLESPAVVEITELPCSWWN